MYDDECVEYFQGKSLDNYLEFHFSGKKDDGISLSESEKFYVDGNNP